MEAAITARLRWLQRLPHLVRGFFANPGIAYITAVASNYPSRNPTGTCGTALCGDLDVTAVAFPLPRNPPQGRRCVR